MSSALAPPASQFADKTVSAPRCTRSCFQCPICIGPLAVNSLESQPDTTHLAAPDAPSATHGNPYILTCSYCNWSSTETGIKFDKPNSIYSQLAKLYNGGEHRLTPKEHKERRKEALQADAVSGDPLPDQTLDVETHFAALKTFYQAQLADANASTSGLSSLEGLGFASPASLSRIMSIYTGGSLHDKRAKSRVGTMREALTSDEGLQLATLDESPSISALRLQHASTIPPTTHQHQPPYLGALPPHTGGDRFPSHLRPIPCLLRTKRSKRCPLCRHIISKPEAKVSTTRFRIRLVAGSYVPSISILPLNIPQPSPDGALPPLVPAQFLLKFLNPIFEPVRVTLATPSKTPGRFGAKVTVLCPEFEIDANTDVWEDALKDGVAGKDVAAGSRVRRGTVGEDGQQQPEVGKIWERGRNWVSIVVEVVPASLRLDLLAATGKFAGGEGVDAGPLREDEDVLEIPMFVRVEWDADTGGGDVEAGAGKDQKEAKEKRELAYWCVLGLGRVRQ